MKSKLSWVRQSQRVIRMVSELHRMGYQRLRIMPYEHPNAWRLAIAPSEHFSPQHGAVIPLGQIQTDAIYSSASGASYFDWADAANDNARQLAEKFLERFPALAARGRGRDWAYAGWLSELLGQIEGGDWLPVTYWEYMQGEPQEMAFLPLWEAGASNVVWCGLKTIPAETTLRFPLPPAG